MGTLRNQNGNAGKTLTKNWIYIFCRISRMDVVFTLPNGAASLLRRNFCEQGKVENGT